MARRREQQPTPGETPAELARRVGEEVARDYGDGVLVDGCSLVSNPPAVIGVSPSIDAITSGGIEEGSWVGVTGQPKSGKTTLCLSFAARCQRPEHGARPIYYLKAEGRLSVVHLRGVRGLDLSPGRFNVVQSREGRILTAQDYLRIAGSVLRSVPGAVLIIDSASSLCDEAEMNSDVAEQTIAPGNKLFSKFVRTNAQVVPVNRSIVLVITHLIANIGRAGYSERVARATQYQYDYMLRTLSKEPWESAGRPVGLKIKWVCNTSKLGPPGGSMVSHLRFGVGFDRLYDAIAMGMDAGLIKGKGWYTLDFLCSPRCAGLFDGKEPPKFQGGEKVYRALEQNPAWAQALFDEVALLCQGVFGENVE